MALTRGHKLDQNTLALWRLDEASGSVTAVDASGHYSSPVGTFSTVVPGLISDGGLAKRFNGASYNIPGDAALGTALLSEWTIEAWINLDTIPVGIDARLVDAWDGAKRFVWFSVSSAAHLEVFWQTGVGQQWDDTTTLTTGTRYHVAARKVSLGGGNYRVDIFVNGYKSSSSGSLPNSTASGTPTAALGTGIGGAPFTGIIDDLRISQVARTDQEISDSYWRGLIDISQIKPVPFQQGASTAWQQWYQQVDPTDLQQPNGNAFQMAVASLKDHLAERRRLAVKAKLPGIAPSDALPQLANERGIFPGPTETDTAFAQRLVAAWNAWPWAGTPFGGLSQLNALGYPNVVFETARGLQYTLDNGGTNMLPFSQLFERSVWVPSHSSVTVNAAAAPDGTTTADKLVEDATTNIHRIFNDVSGITSGLTYTGSVHVKPAGRSRVQLSLGSTGFAATPVTIFDLSAGTVVSGSGAIAALANGWFRISISRTAVATGDGDLVIDTDNGSGSGYLGDGVSGLFLWGAQLEQGGSVGPYTITYGTPKLTTAGAGVEIVNSLPSGSWWIDSNRAPPGITAWAASTAYAAGASVVPSAVTWSASTSFPAGTCVMPTSTVAQTGLYYRSSGGTSGSSQPAWPTTPGGTVNDNGITWTAFRRDFIFKTPSAGTSGSVQPTWPTTYAATVTDNNITWANDGNDNWSRFEVIFPLPLPTAWAGTPPAYSSDEVTRIRKVIRDWSPAFALCNRIVVVQQGGVWGYSDGTWGDGGTWGGTSTVWSPV